MAGYHPMRGLRLRNRTKGVYRAFASFDIRTAHELVDALNDSYHAGVLSPDVSNYTGMSNLCCNTRARSHCGIHKDPELTGSEKLLELARLGRPIAFGMLHDDARTEPYFIHTSGRDKYGTTLNIEHIHIAIEGCYGCANGVNTDETRYFVPSELKVFYHYEGSGEFFFYDVKRHQAGEGYLEGRTRTRWPGPKWEERRRVLERAGFPPDRHSRYLGRYFYDIPPYDREEAMV